MNLARALLALLLACPSWATNVRAPVTTPVVEGVPAQVGQTLDVNQTISNAGEGLTIPVQIPADPAAPTALPVTLNLAAPTLQPTLPAPVLPVQTIQPETTPADQVAGRAMGPAPVTNAPPSADLHDAVAESLDRLEAAPGFGQLHPGAKERLRGLTQRLATGPPGSVDGLLSGFWDASKARAEVLPEIAYLNSLGSIRVFFAAAPNFGHQTATLSIVRRLRELGYVGRIEAVYQEKNSDIGPLVKEKLADLIPDFDPHGPEGQYVPSLGMTVRSFTDFKKWPLPAPLGITGGADRPIDFPAELNTALFLRLGPMDWIYNDALYLADGSHEEIPGGTSRYFIYRTAAATDIDDAYFARLDPAKYPADKVRGLSALARNIGRHDLMAAYGLSYYDPSMLHLLMLGVSTAIDEGVLHPYRKGLVIPLLGNVDGLVEGFLKRNDRAIRGSGFSEDRLESLRRASTRLKARLKIVSIADPDFEAQLAKLKSDGILMVRTGPVPPALFEWLYGMSTLPPTLEGKNAANLARLLGIPFIPNSHESFTGLYYHLPENEWKQRRVTALTGSISDALHSGGDANAFEIIADYIVEATAPGSELGRMFASGRVRPADYQQDKLLHAVRFLMDYTGPQSSDKR